MSGVICVWANVPDDAMEWYEDDYIPQMRIKHAIHALSCELTASGFEADPIGQLDATWPLCTMYNVTDVQKATECCYDKENHPSEAQLTGPLAQARFDVRTYRELKTWQGVEFDGDFARVASVAAMEWQVTTEKVAEIIDFYTSCIGPLVSKSPDTCRLRLLELENATLLQGLSHETKDKAALHTYLALAEFETEEWPWDIAFELSENKQWQHYFEKQEDVKWQVSHYLVKRLYTEEDEKGLGTQSYNDTQDQSE